MSIFKFEFAHTIKQIWVIGEVMPEETSALGQLYDTLGVFGVVQGANEVMLRTLEREMGDTDQHIRQWLQGDDGKYQPVKIEGPSMADCFRDKGAGKSNLHRNNGL